jgi:hypothetical protein
MPGGRREEAIERSGASYEAIKTSPTTVIKGEGVRVDLEELE